MVPTPYLTLAGRKQGVPTDWTMCGTDRPIWGCTRELGLAECQVQYKSVHLSVNLCDVGLEAGCLFLQPSRKYPPDRSSKWVPDYTIKVSERGETRNNACASPSSSRRQATSICHSSWRFPQRTGRAAHRRLKHSCCHRDTGPTEPNSSFLLMRTRNSAAEDRFGRRLPGPGPGTYYATLGRQLCVSVPQFPP